MENTRKFTIDDTVFECDVDQAATQFEVKGIPKNYAVFYHALENPFEKINAMIHQHPESVMIIDKNILLHYQPKFSISLEKIFTITATESHKSLETVTQLFNFFEKNNLTKSAKIIVIGGGVTQEISAFACALYKRGLSWIFFPTTLLAMCDSCLGGKASLNYCDAKNQLGVYSNPETIYIYAEFLTTLTPNDIFSGLSEILKLCIIGGEYFLENYSACVKKGKVISETAYQTLIMMALSVKKAVIEKDPFETHHRMSMNYGHTIGHAIEALANYKISHGQSIALGMIEENKLGVELGLLDKNSLNLLNKLCLDLVTQEQILMITTFSKETIHALIKKDKKATHRSVRYALIKKPGELKICDEPTGE